MRYLRAHGHRIVGVELSERAIEACFAEADETLVSGPPFAVSESEVRTLFGERCALSRLGEQKAESLPPRFTEAGVSEALEVVYRLDKVS